MKNLLSFVTLAALTGCTSYPSAYRAAANEAMTAEVAHPGQKVAGQPANDRLRFMWANRKDALALINAPTPAYAKAPQLLSSPSPEYPPHLRGHGVVVISALIDEHGQVEEARIYQSSDPRLVPPALTAIRQWKFKPAESPTGPMKALLLIPIDFRTP